MKYVVVLAVLSVVILGYSVIPSFGLRYVGKSRQRKDKKVLYLTFDDGPSEYTAALLRLLAKYEIKASFFVVSDFVRQYPDLISRMKREGHMIGIHSAKHQNALFRGDKFSYTDLAASIFNLKKLGVDAVYYRPPWGHLNLFTLYWVKKLNLKLVFWDVMAQDWERKATPDTIENKLLDRIYSGAIICLHDGRGAKGAPGKTIKALEKTIPLLLNQGYQFERLDNNGA